MRNDIYPRFDANYNQPINQAAVGGNHPNFPNVNNKNFSKINKQTEGLNFKLKNLKFNNDNRQNIADANINFFKNKKEEMQKIINKFNSSIGIEDVKTTKNDISNLLKNCELKIKNCQLKYEERNLSVIRSHLDLISVEDFNTLNNDLQKNKILNESFFEKKENEKEGDLSIDINKINIKDHKKMISEFIKKNRNIFLLKFEYKNLSHKSKEHFINYLNKLISKGIKDKGLSAIDFEKLNEELKIKSNSDSNLNNFKKINDYVDLNQIGFGLQNNSINNNNSNNNLYSNYFNINNDLVNYPNNYQNNNINNNLYYNKHPQQENDYFDDIIPRMDRIIQNSKPQIQAQGNSINNLDKNNVNNINNRNANIHSLDNFSLLNDNDIPHQIENDSYIFNYYNNIQNTRNTTEMDKRLARETLINEFQLEINQPDLAYEQSEYFFAGTDDLNFAVRNYYEYKYQDDKLLITFVFPSGNSYSIKKDFTDKPDVIFDEILKIMSTKENKNDLFEFELIQEGRGVISIPKKVKYLGGLNLEKNKKISVRYLINQ